MHAQYVHKNAAMGCVYCYCNGANCHGFQLELSCAYAEEILLVGNLIQAKVESSECASAA